MAPPPPQPLAGTYPHLTVLPTNNAKSLVSPLSRKLFELPEVRTLTLRWGKKLDFEGTVARKNLEATYAFVRGEEAVTPCTKCAAKTHKTWGPFPVCVLAPGDLFGGVCCNCWYSANASRCNLHTTSREWAPASKFTLRYADLIIY
jgi:hypothetical protein